MLLQIIIPPAFPLAPECIWALTTHFDPPISRALYSAFSGLYAIPPRGILIPKPESIFLPDIHECPFYLLSIKFINVNNIFRHPS